MSTHHYHAVVWIDHREARVFHVGAAEADKLVIRPDNPAKHLHHKAMTIGSGKAPEDQHFLHAVAEAVADATEILITGPSGAKTALVKHIHEHDPKLMAKIAGVESVDHPSDGQLLAFARHYFHGKDRMLPLK